MKYLCWPLMHQMINYKLVLITYKMMCTWRLCVGVTLRRTEVANCIFVVVNPFNKSLLH